MEIEQYIQEQIALSHPAEKEQTERYMNSSVESFSKGQLTDVLCDILIQKRSTRTRKLFQLVTGRKLPPTQKDSLKLLQEMYPEYFNALKKASLEKQAVLEQQIALDKQKTLRQEEEYFGSLFSVNHLTPMQKGRLQKTLNKLYSFGKKGIMPLKEYIETYAVGKKSVPDMRDENKILYHVVLPNKCWTPIPKIVYDVLVFEEPIKTPTKFSWDSLLEKS